jgi:phosphoglycolate phosphatase
VKVALFDIDGTLLSTRGAGRRAMEAALTTHFGTAGPADYRYDGKTDRQIARESMRAAGIDDALIDARLPAVLADYLDGLSGYLQDPAWLEVYDGIHAVLDALERRDDVLLGLLTGNVLEGAQVKIAAAALGFTRFRVGAYGSDDERRAALPAIAQARAAALLGRDLPGDRLVIIGDTPHDLTCGRDVGARAIGVATGGYALDDLAPYQPAALFADLRDTAAVVEAILDA